MLIKNSGARKGWWPGPSAGLGPQASPQPLPHLTFKGRMVWELGIQTNIDSYCPSNILWHLPSALPLGQRGPGRSHGPPCFEVLQETLPQPRTREDPKKSLPGVGPGPKVGWRELQHLP